MGHNEQWNHMCCFGKVQQSLLHSQIHYFKFWKNCCRCKEHFGSWELISKCPLWSLINDDTAIIARHLSLLPVEGSGALELDTVHLAFSGQAHEKKKIHIVLLKCCTPTICANTIRVYIELLGKSPPDAQLRWVCSDRLEAWSAFPLFLNVSNRKKRQMVFLHALFKYPCCGIEVVYWHSQPYRHRDAPLSVSWRKSVRSAAVGRTNQEHQLCGFWAFAWRSRDCRHAPALPCAGLVFAIAPGGVWLR